MESFVKSVNYPKISKSPRNSNIFSFIILIVILERCVLQEGLCELQEGSVPQRVCKFKKDCVGGEGRKERIKGSDREEERALEQDTQEGKWE